MALFGKKKDQKSEQLNEEIAVAENETTSEETEAKDEPKFKAVPAAQFSQRIGGVFGKLYRMILSCDLEANVYQIESGEQRIAEKSISGRGYYDTFIDTLSDYVIEDDYDRFRKDFSRQSLAASLAGPSSGFTGVYCIQGDVEDNCTTYNYYEFRADKIPNVPQGDRPAQERIRCIIYVRTVREPQQMKSINEKDAADSEANAALLEARVRKFLGGKASYFFEYDCVKDAMVIHSENAEGKLNQVINNYLKSIEARSDWSIFHSDLSKVTSVLANAINGKSGSAEIRYRLSGVKKNEPYKVFKLQCAPLEFVPPILTVIGALTDIDEEAKSRASKSEYYALVERLSHVDEATLYELDLDKNIIFKVLHTDDGYVRDSHTEVLSEYIEKKLATGTFHPEDAKKYNDILKPGFLEKRTLGGTYAFESRVKPFGKNDYVWHSETFARVGASQRFIRMNKDISELHDERAKEFELREREKYTAYNQNMLDTMASLVEFRNVESGAHVTHVRTLTKILLEDMVNRSPMYDLKKRDIDMYSEAAIMHDIGKIVVPDYILNKEGKLTEEEFEIMKKHTIEGGRIVKRLDLPGQEELMKYCYQVAVYHHERFDGKGYPEGLVGDATPIGVQAVGLADVYDAIVSVRCYKSGLSHEDAVNMIIRGDCGAFNPRLIESFKACKDRMHALYHGDLSREKFDYSTLNNNLDEEK